MNRGNDMRRRAFFCDRDRTGRELVSVAKAIRSKQLT